MEFEIPADIDGLFQLIDDLDGEVSSWLATADDSTWTGVTSAITAYGLPAHVLETILEDFNIDDVTDDNAIVTEWNHLLIIVNADDAVYRAATNANLSDELDNQIQDDMQAYVDIDGWAEIDIENRMENDGVDNETANDNLMTDVGAVASAIFPYLKKVRAAFKRFMDVISEATE